MSTLVETLVTEIRSALEETRAYNPGEGDSDWLGGLDAAKHAIAPALRAAARRARKNVVVELTPAEARALSFAAGEMLSDPDAVKGWMPGASGSAAYRAAAKLEAAAAARGSFSSRSRGSAKRR